MLVVVAVGVLLWFVSWSTLPLLVSSSCSFVLSRCFFFFRCFVLCSSCSLRLFMLLQVVFMSFFWFLLSLSCLNLIDVFTFPLYYPFCVMRRKSCAACCVLLFLLCCVVCCMLHDACCVLRVVRCVMCVGSSVRCICWDVVMNLVLRCAVLCCAALFFQGTGATMATATSTAAATSTVSIAATRETDSKVYSLVCGN